MLSASKHINSFVVLLFFVSNVMEMSGVLVTSTCSRLASWIVLVD